MVTFSFRKFIKCVESHYAACESYRDSGWIENCNGSGQSNADKVSKVYFQTEFDRFGLFRFEWRNQNDLFTRNCPNSENVVWVDMYGAFGRFDFEENTRQFLDLAQALESCNTLSNGASSLVASMLYPELRQIFSRPACPRRPSKLQLLQHNRRSALLVVWQRADAGLLESRQVIFDLNDFSVMEICDTVRTTDHDWAEEESEPQLSESEGVLGRYLSTAGKKTTAGDGGDLMGSTRIVFENVSMTQYNTAYSSTLVD